MVNGSHFQDKLLRIRRNIEICSTEAVAIPRHVPRSDMCAVLSQTSATLERLERPVLLRGTVTNCYSCSGNVRRALTSSLLSLLLLTTLVWGGCISCEQFFMWPGAKGCCEHDGRCKPKTPFQKSGGLECNKIAFDHQKSVDLQTILPAVVVRPFDAPLSIQPIVAWRGAPAVEPSPPDLQVLHSTV